MRLASISAAAAVLVSPVLSLSVPSLKVPACPNVGTIHYDKSVPNKTAFPETQVDLCYTDKSIHIVFTALDEKYFYYNASLQNNDAIYEYEVMETFIYHGTKDPQTYLEFEVAPNNVTYQAFVYNPTKVRATGAPFDHFFVTDPTVDGLTAQTVLNKPKETWVSTVNIPLGFFNVDDGQANGTQWRMNFFRTVTNKKMFPNQLLGGWSPPDAANFHETPYFGHVLFV